MTTIRRRDFRFALPLLVAASAALVLNASGPLDAELLSGVGSNESCDPALEFACSHRHQCLPVEAKCDFTEQCWAGEDELGCAPSYCNFHQDFCNWRNTFDDQSGGSTARRQLIWRRHFVDKRSPASEPPTDKDRLLARLSGDHPHGSRFLFAAFQFESHLQETSSAPTGEAATANTTTGGEWRQLASQSATLAAPTVGQTRSSCQLRFRYSLGAAAAAEASRPLMSAPTMSGEAATNFEYKMALSLNLWARQRPSIKEASGNSSGCSPVVGGQSGGKALLWSRAIELAGGASILNGEPQTANGDWAIGVLELGRAKRIELNFEASASLMRRECAAKQMHRARKPAAHLVSSTIAQPASGKSSRVWESKVAEASGRGGGASGVLVSRATEDRNATGGQPIGAASLSGLVGLDWLEFHQCNWPREGHQTGTPPTRREPSLEPLLDDRARDFNDHTICSSGRRGDDCSSGGHESAPPLGDGEAASVAACGPRQFRCSNDICLDERRLCNFVDDCMNSPASPKSAGGGVPGGSGQAEEGAHLEPGGEVEDESRLLCEPVPGMEDFERASVEQMVAPTGETGNRTLDSGKLLDSFWSLVGDGWQQQGAKLIDVRDNHKLEAHLPKRDHTTRSSDGKFLSLTIPQPQVAPPEASAKLGQRNVRWSYIKSPWMRKLDVESGECRVKFFFNLVTDEPAASDASDHSDLTFKVYLAVDHFVVERIKAPSGPNNKSSASETLGLSRRVDSILLSHVVDYERLVLDGELAFIEFPGVDFWREVNVNLVDLREGDTFQIRIAIIIEMDDKQADKFPRATINLDDLSTHFGCSLTEDEETELAQSFEGRLRMPMSLGEFLRPPPGPFRLAPRRSRLTSEPIQVEPQLLVVYVFGVLMLIMGFIAAIVFVLVPYVERATMNYQDRISLELNGAQEMPPPGGHSHYLSTQSSSMETRDFASGSDWERLSRHQVTGGQQSGRSAYSGGGRAAESMASTIQRANSFGSLTGADSIGSARNLITTSDEDEDNHSSTVVSFQTVETRLSNSSNNNFFTLEKSSSSDTTATTTATSG